MTRFSERIPAVKQRMSVYILNGSAHVNIAKESVIQIMLQFTRKIIVCHSHDGHGFARGMEFRYIIHTRYWKMTPTGQKCVCLWIFQDELLCNHMTASFFLSGQHSTLTIHCVPNTHPQFIPKISAYTDNIRRRRRQQQCLSIIFLHTCSFQRIGKI